MIFIILNFELILIYNSPNYQPPTSADFCSQKINDYIYFSITLSSWFNAEYASVTYFPSLLKHPDTLHFLTYQKRSNVVRSGQPIKCVFSIKTVYNHLLIKSCMKLVGILNIYYKSKKIWNLKLWIYRILFGLLLFTWIFSLYLLIGQKNACFWTCWIRLLINGRKNYVAIIYRLKMILKSCLKKDGEKMQYVQWYYFKEPFKFIYDKKNVDQSANNEIHVLS